MNPADPPIAHGATPSLLSRARRQAGRILWIEQIWPAILPALAIVLVVVILSLLTVPQRLPVWLHGLFLLGCLVAIATLLRDRLRPLRTPTTRARDGRLERASRLPHQPLATLADRPLRDLAPGEPAMLIWQAHVARTGNAIGSLRTGLPQFGLSRRQQAALWPLALLLALALAVAGREAPVRIASGFWPGVEMPLGPKPALQAWITRPDFAAGAPLFLTDPHGLYEVPAGSILTLSLTGPDSRPSFRVSRSQHRAARFDRLSAGSWTSTLVLSASTRVAIRASGYRLADWNVTVLPVLPPVISWQAAPGPSPAEPHLTRLPWSVEHRYGVRGLLAELRLAQPGKGSARVLRVPIPLSGTPRSAKGIAMPDLSADPWAGEAVVARLVGTDTAGQEGHSGDATFTLPQIAFRNPLARAVIDVRRRLALGRETPSDAADDLQALGDTPGQFAQDSSLFLNLAATAALLRQSVQAAEAGYDQLANDQASDRLWDLAQALEDGLHNDRAGARAALDVRNGQDAVARQLERMRQLGEKGQSDREQSELQRRIEALSAAIGRRMQALADQARREHGAMPPVPDAATLGGQDLSRMLQQMREAAAGGDSQKAMQQLSQMQSMLDHMRAATPQDLENARAQAAARQQALDQMKAVQDLVQRQAALLDHSQARQSHSQPDAQPKSGTPGSSGNDGPGQEGSAGGTDAATQALLRQLGLSPDGSPLPGASGGSQTDANQMGQPAATPASPKELAERQAQQQADGHLQRVLHRALDELGSEFKALTGKQAASFDDADKAMVRARDGLAAGQDDAASQAQMQALAALQKGAQQMHKAMSGGSGSSGGLALLPGGSPGSGGSEPGADESGADGSPGAESGGDKDPLGRHLADGHSGMDDGSETHVPENAEPARSREIEQELRRRDSDRTRPPQELDYLDRLLKAF